MFLLSMLVQATNTLPPENKKDPGIPNNYPFKEEILAEVQRERTEVL